MVIMNILSALEHHNLTLPRCSTPGGSYESVNIRGQIAYVAIQISHSKW